MRRLYTVLSLLLALLTLPLTAYSADGYTLLADGKQYATAILACEAAKPLAAARYPGYSIDSVNVQSPGSSSTQCTFNVTKLSTGQKYTGQGFLCSDLPTCSANRYTCTVGAADSVEWPIGPTDANKPTDILGEPTLPPSPLCASGCMLDLGTVEPSDCFTFEDGSSPFTFCDFPGTRNGDTCSTTDEPAKPDSSSCPSGTVSQGSGCVTEPPPDPCEADPEAEGCGGGDPGGGQCETDPTAPGCPGGGDPCEADPLSQECQESGGGDPGGDPCETDPNAEGCPGGGDPGGGGEDPDPDQVPSAECGEPFSCNSDPFECAALKFQRIEYCENKAALDFNSQKDEVAEYLKGDQFKAQDDEEIDLGSMFSEGTRFLPSSCPEPESFHLISAGGRTFAFTYEPLCQLASDLSFLIVAAAGVFFAVYVGRATGG